MEKEDEKIFWRFSFVAILVCFSATVLAIYLLKLKALAIFLYCLSYIIVLMIEPRIKLDNHKRKKFDLSKY